MDSAQTLPILKYVDTAILGGTSAAVEIALKCTREGEKTLLLLQESFLGTDRAIALDYPEGMTPDAYKLELERRCTENSVELLYGVWVLDVLPAESGRQLIRIGGKFGIAGIVARTVLDHRICWTDDTCRAWLTDRADPAGVQILEVANPCPAEQDTAARLLRGRLAVLEAYRERNLSKKWALGRFAIRGGRIMPPVNDRSTSQVRHAVTSRICPLRGGSYPYIKTDPYFSGTESAWDLLVVGGGTSGSMAALAAAQKGLRVAVVEPNYAIGGTGTVGGVSAYWFGTRYSDSMEVDELVAQSTDPADRDKLPGIWGSVDSWNPDVKATVLLQLLTEAGAEVFFGCCAFGVWSEAGKTAGIAACAESGIHFFRAPYIFDSTGDGDIAVFAGADSEYGNSVDCVSYWASLAQYKTAGTYQNNFSAMMRTDDPVDYTRFVLNARKFGENLFDHGSYGCCRESRHIRGKTRITLQDLMTHTHHPDTLYTCYSNYDPKGKTTADIVYCGVLPQQTVIEIPLSALIPVDSNGNQLEGIYVLGKAISASHDIFPSIRMQKDLMHQGTVMGNLIADCKQLSLRPEQLPPEELRRLLRTYSDDPLRAPVSDAFSMEECVRRLNAKSRTHWVDADFTDCETDFQPLVALMYGSPDTVVPLLEEKLSETADPEERAVLIRIQLWHGCDWHAEEFLDRMAAELSGPVLPKRRGATTCAQLLPDHGVMPEIVYDMNVLAYSQKERCAEPFQRVYDLLTASQRDYRDLAQGIFPYIESFAFAAERNGNPQILDLAEKLTALPELVGADRMPDSDLMKQRLQLLRYLLYRALAANGRLCGYRGLAAQLHQPSLTLALSSRKILEEIFGLDLGPELWPHWIQSHENRLPQKRITEKTF